MKFITRLLPSLGLVFVADALVAPSFLNHALKPAGHAAPRRRVSSQLSMIDPAALMFSVASAAAVPTVFVGTGTFLLQGESDEDEDSPTKSEDGEVDIYRDTLLRYAGYANEVGEAFAPIVPAIVVPASYGVAITYVFADTLDKYKKGLQGGKYKPGELNAHAGPAAPDPPFPSTPLHSSPRRVPLSPFLHLPSTRLFSPTSPPRPHQIKSTLVP